MKRSTTGLLAAALAAAHALGLAYDNGPQTLGCDHRFGGKSETGTCLVVGSGTNQGILWVVLEVKGKRYRFEDSEPDVIALIDKNGNVLKRLKGGRETTQCRAGGNDADTYAFANGDRICLYWR